MAKDEARELAKIVRKKKNNRKPSKVGPANYDFDDLNGDIDTIRNKENAAEEVLKSSFVMMPVGINRKGLK